MAACDSVLGEMSEVTITYLPGTGGSRQIDCQIHYLGPEQMDGLRGGSRPQFDLLVKNNALSGISSKLLDTARDKAQIPLRIGEAVKTVRLVKIMAQDKAMLRLRAW
jgi:hypothetical protein